MKLLKKTICIVLCIITLTLFGCSQRGTPIIDGYRDFIENYEKYDVHNDDKRNNDNTGSPSESDKTTEDRDDKFAFDITEFSPVIEKEYDSVRIVSENLAIATRDDSIFLVKSGNETPIDFIKNSDFGEVSFINEYYIVSSRTEGKILIGTDGKAITSDYYEEITAVGNVAFCYNEATADVIIENKIVHRNVSGNIRPLTEKYCFDNTKSLVLSISDFSPVYIGGLPIIDVPHDDIAIVKNNNKWGYANVISNTIIVEPQYFVGSQFSCGYTDVRMNSSSDYPLIIDKTGNQIFDFGSSDAIKTKYNAREIEVFSFFDGFVLFEATHLNEKKYGCINLLDPTKPELSFISGKPFRNRAFGKYAILEEFNKLSDLTTNKFVDLNAEKITPTSDGFIIKRSSGCSLIDYELNEIVSDIEYLDFGDGLYIVGNNKKFYICTK